MFEFLNLDGCFINIALSCLDCLATLAVRFFKCLDVFMHVIEVSHQITFLLFQVIDDYVGIMEAIFCLCEFFQQNVTLIFRF